MTIAATVVRDQQSSALASVVRGREEARNSATAYIFITLWAIARSRKGDSIWRIWELKSKKRLSLGMKTKNPASSPA